MHYKKHILSWLEFESKQSLLFIFHVLLDVICDVHEQMHIWIPSNVFKQRNLKIVNLNYCRNANLSYFLVSNHMCFKELKVILKTGSHDVIVGDFIFINFSSSAVRVNIFAILSFFNLSTETWNSVFYENKLITAKESGMLLIMWLKQITPFVKH